ncbi:hypothetical protein [Mesorhizobium metallidurans]|uniref:hypothetical protein n=1 Tax=Mesorhizobium metallidurans TaxID=489722 RepID=UPI0005908CF0|nr:hypothetical protein [Mesorhizobium metallidurans]
MEDSGDADARVEIVRVGGFGHGQTRAIAKTERALYLMIGAASSARFLNTQHLGQLARISRVPGNFARQFGCYNSSLKVTT